MLEGLLRGSPSPRWHSTASLFSVNGLCRRWTWRGFAGASLVVRRWWLVTTSGEFLSSPSSRRWLWRWIVAAVGFLDFFADLFDGQDVGVLVIDLLAIAIGIMIGRWLPVNSLLSDAALTSMAAVCMHFYFSLAPPSESACAVVNIPWTPIMVLLLHAVGVHIVFVSLYCVLTFGYMSSLHPHSADNCLTVRIASSAMLGFAACMEFHTAVVWSKYQKQITVTNRLLDTITDGFCSIDGNGAILETSPQLQETLGCENLVGRLLGDFVEEGRDRAKLGTLQECVAAGAAFKRNLVATPPFIAPILVTMHREVDKGSFEAKMSSYDFLDSESKGGRVCICFQRQGEVRVPETQTRAHGARGAASAATLERQQPNGPLAVLPNAPVEACDAWSETSVTNSFGRMVEEPGPKQFEVPLGPPFVPSDLYTFEHSLSLLEDLVESWNIGGKACCLWHLNVARLSSSVTDLHNKRRCNDGWAPEARSWQCSSCLALNSPLIEASSCWLCGTPVEDTSDQSRSDRSASATGPPGQLRDRKATSVGPSDQIGQTSASSDSFDLQAR